MSEIDTTVWPEWLNRREASAYLRARYGIKLGPAALANLAVEGGGPPYHKDGGRLVSYYRTDLDSWAPKRMRRVKSTSELRQRAEQHRNQMRDDSPAAPKEPVDGWPVSERRAGRVS
jgi:hypothetical protein